MVDDRGRRLRFGGGDSMTLPVALLLLQIVSGATIEFSSIGEPPSQEQPAESPPEGYFVSPTGTAGGDGSINDPWDIKTALAGPVALQPGDTVWMRGGVYGNARESLPLEADGTAANKIVFRSYPGEWARVRGWINGTSGNHVRFQDFEIFSDETNRDYNNNAPAFSDGMDWYGGEGIEMVNLVIRYRRNGLGIWVGSTNMTVHGCLIYYNGARGPTRGHYHGIYSQNQAPSTRVITDNIFFDSWGYGMQHYGGGGAYVENYTIDGNIMANAGSLYSTTNKHDNLLIGGAQATYKENIVVTNNMSYHTPSTNDGYSRIGLNWDDGGGGGDNPSGDVTLTDNYWIGGEYGLWMWFWDSVTFLRNTLYTDASPQISNTVTAVQLANNVPSYTWDNNTYYGDDRFIQNGTTYQDLAAWRSATGFDTNSTHTEGRPTGVWTVVTDNDYEANRGHVTVYNWDGNATVAVDLSSIVANGVDYEIRDAQNYFGTPVVTGTYNGGTVNIPMTGLTKETNTGSGVLTPAHTAPEFGVFIVKEP